MRVKVYEIYQDGRERLMNDITETSKFSGHIIPRARAARLSSAEKVIEHGRIIARGWRQNGSRPFSRFKLVIDPQVRGGEPREEFV